MELYMNKDIQTIEDISQFGNILKSAFNTVQDIFYIMEVRNEEFYYYFANQAGRGHLDYGKELVGNTFHDVLPKEKADFLTRHYRKCINHKKTVVFNDEVIIDDQRYINESVLTPFTYKEQLFVVSVVRDVTEYNKKIMELNHNKESIENNEERLYSLIHNDEDVVLTIDSEGFILESNKACKRLLGYTQFEIVGLKITKLFQNSEKELLSHKLQFVLEKNPVQFKTHLYHKNGYKVYIQLKFIPLTIQGKVSGVYGIMKDISAEMKDYEKVSKSESQLRSLIDHNADAIYTTNLEGRIIYVNDSFVKTFGYDREDILNTLNPTIPDWLAAETYELYQSAFDGRSIKDVHVVRQKANGNLIDLSVTLSPIYDHLGEITGIASVARDITDAKQKDLQINQENQELKLAWKYATDAMMMINHNGEIIKVNSTYKKMFLDNEQDTLSATDFYLTQHKNHLQEVLRILKDEKKFLQFETKRMRKDGTIIDVLATYRKVDDGNIFVIGIYKDITKEKQILQELAESESKYRKVLDSSPDPLLIHNGEIITYANKALLNLAKAKNSSLVLGLPIVNFVFPSEKEFVLNKVKLATQIDSSEPVIQRFINLDGETIYAETTTASFQEQGQQYAIVMLRDVTQKRRADKALKESEQRFRIIAENTNSLIKILAPNGKVTYCSPSIEEILGIPVCNEIGKCITSNIHTEDILLFESSLEQCIFTKKTVQVEIRYIHRNGFAVWLNTHITPILNENEDVEKIMLISTDITELKQKESKLTKMAFYDYLTNLPNRRLFYKQLDQAMLTTDKTSKISALMIVDCDKFKSINDTYGHNIGDEVIKEFANRLKLSLRNKDTISRIGGDEFTVVLPEMNSVEEVTSIAEQLLNKMSEPIYKQGHEIQLTASIGITIYSSYSYSTEELFKKADQCLYRSKEIGGNMYTID